MYEGEYGDGEFDEAEAGEAEEQFLHKILGKVLGQEAEYGEPGDVAGAGGAVRRADARSLRRSGRWTSSSAGS